MANIASPVPWIPPYPATGDIVAGAPVVGPGQWQDMALTAAWLIGRGGTLVCMGPCAQMLVHGAASVTLYFPVLGREQIKARIWFLGLALASGYSQQSATGTVQFSGVGTTHKWSLAPIVDPATGVPTDPPTGQTQTFRFVEAITAPTNTVEITGCVITLDDPSASTASVVITGLYCRDVPMADVYLYAGAAQYAPDGANGFLSNATIQNAGGASTTGVEALANTQGSSTAGSGVRNEARRAALFHWCDLLGPFTTTSAAYTPVFIERINVLARHLHYVSGTQTPGAEKDVDVRVYAATTGGTPTATIKITNNTSGATWTINVTSATPTFYSTSITIDSDDMTRMDVYGGTRAGGRCGLTFEAKVVGSTSVSIYAVSIGEDRRS